jgi:hypothetical protein
MLIVLSGCETIHKKFFGRKIVGTLNKFYVDGHAVDFANDNFEVTDSTGALIHRASDGTVEGINDLIINQVDGSLNQEGHDTLMKIVKLHEDLLLTGSRNNHFGSAFLNLWYDYGIFKTPEDYARNSAGFLHPHTYADVLNNYRNRTYENFVITGIFSRYFIDSLKADLGADNVKVINIVRNPSVCFLLNEKSAEYYSVPHPTNFRTPVMDHKKLLWSIWNAHNLSRFDDVTTLKFEDIIKNGSFTVNGVSIGVPAGYDNHNKWLTVWEKDNIIKEKTVLPASVLEFNKFLTDFAPYKIDHEFTDLYPNVTSRADFIQLINRIRDTSLTADAMDTIPVDMFTALGYTPLAYNNIVNP